MPALLLLLFACTCQGEAPVVEPEATLADPPPGAPEPGPHPVELPPPTGLGVEGGEGAAPAGGTDSATQVIRVHRGEIQACYEQALARDRSLRGRVALGIEVQAGRVVAVDIQDDLGDAAMGACIESAVQTWGFHESVTGTVYPTFVLAPEE